MRPEIRALAISKTTLFLTKWKQFLHSAPAIYNNKWREWRLEWNALSKSFPRYLRRTKMPRRLGRGSKGAVYFRMISGFPSGFLPSASAFPSSFLGRLSTNCGGRGGRKFGKLLGRRCRFSGNVNSSSPTRFRVLQNKASRVWENAYRTTAGMTEVFRDAFRRNLLLSFYVDVLIRAIKKTDVVSGEKIGTNSRNRNRMSKVIYEKKLWTDFQK